MMTTPTIAARLQKKFILMTHDSALQASVQAVVPEGWEMVATLDLDSLGGFEQVLLYRFVFLDLESLTDDFDPQDAIRKIRMELMLNVAIFCFGGCEDERDQARLNRADRFFEHDEMPARLPQFCHQYRWGE